MTKEELKQEAEKSRLSTKNGHDLSYDPKYREVYDKAYIAGATEATRELKEGLEVAETLNKSLNAMNKDLEAERDKYRNMVFDLQEQGEQLTKAKAIIKTCLGFMQAFGYSPSIDKLVTEAEQFLNSEVEK